MASEPIPLDLPPGFLRNTTRAAATGRYTGGYHVRFKDRKPQKIGGFVKYLAEQTIGVVHGAFAWITRVGSNRLLAIGTFAKAYSVLDSLDDITPVRASGTLATDPFAVVDGETTVTVTHTAHGIDAENGAYAIFSGATAGGGITIDGEYLATYVDANSYTIEHSAEATSTDATTGGASVGYSYLLNNGLSDTVIGLGIGVGPVGAGTVGTPRTSGGIRREMRTWFFDTAGNLLAFLPSGGTVYTWDEPGAADRGVAVTNAPSSARAMFITAERMIVMLGTTTPMTIEWCDRDVNTNWTPGEGSTANTRVVQTGNRLIAGTRFPTGGGQCFWSDLAFYGMQFVGSTDFIYETPVLAYDAGLIGPLAFELTRDLVIWITPGFELMIYDGSVRPAPNFGEVREYLRKRVDRSATDKMALGRVAAHEEIWIHYTSVDSVDGENDEYCIVGLADWSYVTGPTDESKKLFKRSGHCHCPRTFGPPFMMGTDRYIYVHENTLDADGAVLPWRLEMARIALANGAIEADVNGYVPDLERHAGQITMEIDSFERPNSQTAFDEQTVTIDEGDGIVDMVVGARYVELAWECEILNSDFRFGVPLIDVGPGGASR